MLAPQACVAVEIAGPSAAAEQRAALEQRCSEILGAGRCRIVIPGQDDAACWHAQVTPAGEATPAEASVVLRDDTNPTHVPVRRDIAFRPNDSPRERWATLGLVIAALVTVEEHSAAEAAAPVAPAPAGGAIVVQPAPVAPGVPLEGALRASAVGGFGLLPSAALGARLEASLARGHLELLARGTIFPGESRASLSAGGAAGDLQLAAAGLGVCGRTGGAAAAWSARLCAAGDVTRLRARGVGVAETNSAVDWSPTVSGVASVARRLGTHVALTLEAELVARLERPTFAIAGAPSVYRPSRVGAVAGLGLAVPF